MISLFFKAVKTSFFILIVIGSSHLIQWKGVSLSSYIENEIILLKESKLGSSLRSWSERAITQTQKKMHQGKKEIKDHSKKMIKKIETIQPTEQAKLRALIQELNQVSVGSRN
tara:strand:+ start:831 stop:1169 length:339 start_codon:yes stop_codon:yes gene_type:complete